MKADIGMIGLGVMGRSLAQNIESKGYTVAVFNITQDLTNDFEKLAKNKNFIVAYDIKSFIDSLSSPKKIFLMVKAGEAVDGMIDILIPYLSPEDIIIDGGNSYYEDTIRRNRYLSERKIGFIGTGISGGEEGALYGPSIMPGGSKGDYEKVKEILMRISAKAGEDHCCDYIGSDGAGHYVKMIHNGIEYADMQLIGEAYSLLKHIVGLTEQEMSEVFEDWNDGELDSYLIDITSRILAKKDKSTGKPVVSMILDKAGQKGTGSWSGESALRLGIPAPTIVEAVMARNMSAIKEQRVKASKIFRGDKSFSSAMLIKMGLLSEGEESIYESSGEVWKVRFIEKVRKALYASKICTYAQGFALMQAASEEYNWELNPGNIAMIFRNGCIIRAKFLNKIKEAYDKEKGLANLMLGDYFKKSLNAYKNEFREVVAVSVVSGVACPAFSSALAYFDGYRSANLSANLIQAQRDFFGAHTFERTDMEGSFHYDWIK